MADVWSGDIALPDGNMIKDVGFASPMPSTTLRFLATVDTAKIPLYLSAGPSLDVWTTCDATEEWFEAMLLSKPVAAAPVASHGATLGWWDTARSQSPVGILVQVQTQQEEPLRPRVTEILFYGTISPPGSAPLPNAHAELLPELRVHALPLSSDLVYHQAAVDTSIDTEAQFLAPPITAPASPKRKRDIFEEATVANRKSRGRGGLGIAAAASSADSKASPFPDFRPPSRQLSRSPSISSDTRPLSRKGIPDGHGKRSNLSRVDTVSSQPEEPTTTSRNKDALSKVVMAAMRMHGLQQRKKTRSRRASMAPGPDVSQQIGNEVAADEAATDEEYKLVYHQTYKSAAFALRQHMSEKPLHSQPDRLRHVVEQLLAIFLSDPLVQPLPTDDTSVPIATPGSKQHLGIPGSSHSHASPFDLPSAARPGLMRSVTDPYGSTGSPISRKKLVKS